MTAATDRNSQAYLEQQAHLLLEEWGECQRREPHPLSRTMHPIQRAMDELGRRSDGKVSLAAYRRKTRFVDAGGRKVPAVSMSPDRADTNSRGGAKVPDPWPGHVEAVDAVLAKMPKSVVDAVIVYYVHGHSIRIGAQVCRVQKDEFRTRLERARWAIIGALDVVLAEG